MGSDSLWSYITTTISCSHWNCYLTRNFHRLLQNYVTVTLCIFFDDRDLCFHGGTHCMSNTQSELNLQKWTKSSYDLNIIWIILTAKCVHCFPPTSLQLIVVYGRTIHWRKSYEIQFRNLKCITSLHIVLPVRPNLFRDFTAVTRTAKWTVFREMGSFPWNSVKFCNFARSLIHFLNIFPMHVLCSAFAITFIHIIKNYPLKCNPFALCLLTVQQSPDVTLNVEAERSVSQYTAANSAQRQSTSKCNLANQVIIAKNSKTANNWAEKLVVATDKLN